MDTENKDKVEIPELLRWKLEALFGRVQSLSIQLDTARKDFNVTVSELFKETGHTSEEYVLDVNTWTLLKRSQSKS